MNREKLDSSSRYMSDESQEQITEKKYNTNELIHCQGAQGYMWIAIFTSQSATGRAELEHSATNSSGD